MDKESKINYILSSKIVLLFLFFVLITPQTIFGYLTDYSIVYVLRFCAFLLIAYKSIVFIKEKRKISLFIFILFIYEIVRVTISLYHNSNPSLDIFVTRYLEVCPCAFCVLSEIEIKRNKEHFFEVLSIFCKSVIYYEFFSYFTMNFIGLPSAFLGDNQYFCFFILGALVAYVDTKLNNKKSYKYYILWIIETIILVVAQTMTGVVSMVCFYVILFLLKFKPIKMFINSISLLVLNVLSFFAVIVFDLQKMLPSFIFENILHKSNTFTFRTGIWKTFIKHITNSPLIGYGAYHNTLFFGYDITDVPGFYYPHNLFLDQLYTGGIVLYIVYFAMLAFITFEIYKNKDSDFRNVFSVFLFTLLTSMLMESYTVLHVYPIYIILSNIDEISNKNISSSTRI